MPNMDFWDKPFGVHGTEIRNRPLTPLRAQTRQLPLTQGRGREQRAKFLDVTPYAKNMGQRGRYHIE